MSTLKFVSFLTISSVFATAYAHNLDQITEGDIYLQGGVFFASGNDSQDIGITGLIGNEYTTDNHDNSNALIGLGYFFDITQVEHFLLQLGVNAFYFFETNYQGDIIQEQMFHNLSYSYDVNHLPVYLALKGIFNHEDERLGLTFDVGIGPNFIRTSDYQEQPLDNITIPDNAFSGKTTTQLSAMAGVGIIVYDVVASVDLELGYRFFYLGEGEFNAQNPAYENELKTGALNANAIILSAVF